jgi:hypothetical protein
MSSKAAATVSVSRNNSKEELIKKYDYELEIKQYKINELENLCDKLMITIDDQEKKIEEQHNEIINLLELLKFANPELLKVYIKPYSNDECEL